MKKSSNKKFLNSCFDSIIGKYSVCELNWEKENNEWGDIENDIRFYGKLCAYGLLTAGTTQAVEGNITYLQVFNGARTTATIAMNGARLSVTGARMGLGLLKQPFVATGGSLGAEAQMIAWYKMGSTGADAVGQILQGNNLSTWNWGATFGNLYFSNPFASNLPGAAYDYSFNPKATFASSLTNYAIGSTLGFGASKINIYHSGFSVGLNLFVLPLMSGVAATQFSKPFEKP